MGHKEFCIFFNIPFDLNKSPASDLDADDNLQGQAENSDTDSDNEADERFAPKVSKKKNQQLPLKNMQVSHEFKQTPRCCDCFGQNGKGTCARKCPCKKEGRSCVSCYPSSKGNCVNCKIENTSNVHSAANPRIKKFAIDKLFDADAKLGLKSQCEDSAKLKKMLTQQFNSLTRKKT